ncbi:choice-of-anchor I family protein [Planctomonas deserti]|uniref:choice-of-anchor I family protein n=1 Tax=Planctomonas deserti TaxID=2144185 RepID=UPI001F0B9214|nr:choice-of-anchor I family protein [Planctomonas deserti]
MKPSSFRRPALVVACSIVVASVSFGFVAPATADIVSAPVGLSAPDAALELAAIGTYETGIFDESAAEIVTYFAAKQRLLVVNAAQAKVEVLSIADPSAPEKLFDLQTTGVTASDGSVVPMGAVANSVAVRPDGLGAIAVESDVKTDAGWVVFFDAAGNGTALGAVRVGALPDMLTFTPDGSRIVVANEGEPAEDYSVDPEGSVTVIGVPSGIAPADQSAVSTADFHAFEAGGTAHLPAGVRIFGGREDAGTGVPDRPVSENLEPEYATVSADSTTAWVTLQEANAIAEVDLATATVTAIRDLGVVDRMTVPFDASDEDGAIAIRSWPVLGFPMPDSIDSYEVDGATYLVTANEGDSRDWEGYSEVARVKDLAEEGPGPVCADAFDAALGLNGVPTDAAALLEDGALGRLTITTADGFDEERGCFTQLYTFGSRSMSIWDASGEQVWDSGDAFERIIAEAVPEFFNSNHSESGFDGRSDDKGPEPEGLTIGVVDGRTYAFVGFERVGGVAVFDVTEPTDATFVTYLNNRNFAVSAEDDGPAGAGDLGPEGLTFIPAEESPTGGALLAVGNEVSGTTTLFSVAPTELDPAPVPPAPNPGTPAPVTPAPNPGTPAPVTPAPISPAPVAPAPVAPDPTTPAPAAPSAPRPSTGTGSTGAADEESRDEDELAYTGTDSRLAAGAAAAAALLMLGGAALVLIRLRRRSA